MHADLGQISLEYPSSYALVGGRIFTGEKLFPPGYALEICADRVRGLVKEEALDQDKIRISVNGNVIAPGFVDLQLNGCAGVMFNDHIEPMTLDIMHATNLKSGCTSFLPTLISTSEENMCKAMFVVKDYRRKVGNLPVLGLHLEGPYISKQRLGIHSEEAVQDLGPEIRAKLIDFAKKTPLLLTLAPECVQTEDIQILTQAGVIVSLGHSAASYEQAKAAIKAGAHVATHLFNAMPAWQGREPGLLGAIFDSPEISCGMIADGLHVHFASLALSKRLKGARCFLISDATAAAGADIKEFFFAGQKVYVKDGKCLNAEGTLGGSALTMLQAVSNGVKRIGWSLEESLRMASLYPARIMGQDSDLGRIAPGAYANLAIFSPGTFNLNVSVDRGKIYQV